MSKQAEQTRAAYRQIYIQIAAAGMPHPSEEFYFLKPRRFRFDLCWPDLMLAIEYEGGAYTKHGHRMSKNFVSDCEKYTLAALHGYTVIRITVDQLRKGYLLKYLELYNKLRG